MLKHTIGYAANVATVGIDTVRFYERKGLLSRASRAASGYRLYSDADIQRLRFICQAKTLSFTLEGIAGLLKLQDGGGGREQVRARGNR